MNIPQAELKLIRPEKCFCREITLQNEKQLQSLCGRKPYRQEILSLLIIVNGAELPVSFCFLGREYSEKIRSQVVPLIRRTNLNLVQSFLKGA